MTPTEFRDRLEDVTRRTGLTASDLAVWFERPRPTVRTWLFGVKPQPQIGGHVWEGLTQRLLWLEFAAPVFCVMGRVSREQLLKALDNERLKSVRRTAPERAPAADDRH